ncbi:hypothetical protein [Pareuzebyella sediminis]|uniref:hypothetical protein n=1 Tax=Pareuzebyella sediminis TaxID=2607998 RepID=UPI0011ED18E9|nr:hypothetical protein [Pareuzebyella sediminis]
MPAISPSPLKDSFTVRPRQEKTIHEQTYLPFFWTGQLLIYSVRRWAGPRGQGVFKIKHEMSNPPFYFEKTIQYEGFEDTKHRIVLNGGWNKVKIVSPSIEYLEVLVFH